MFGRVFSPFRKVFDFGAGRRGAAPAGSGAEPRSGVSPGPEALLPFTLKPSASEVSWQTASAWLLACLRLLGCRFAHSLFGPTRPARLPAADDAPGPATAVEFPTASHTNDKSCAVCLWHPR